jgi:hypothetical protein
VAHVVGGGVMKKGEGSFGSWNFYSQSIERELAVGPHVGVDG